MNLLTSSIAFKPQKQNTRFSEIYTFDQRCTQSKKIREQYPNHVLLIVEPAETKNQKNKVTESLNDSKNIKTKYIVPNGQTVGKFLSSFRKNITLSENQALYLLTLDNTTPSLSMTISQLDKKHQSEDGFLYLKFTGENAFGSV